MVDKKQALLNRIRIAENYRKNLSGKGKANEKWHNYYDSYIAICRKKLYDQEIKSFQRKAKFFYFSLALFLGILILAVSFFYLAQEQEISLAPPSVSSFTDDLSLTFSESDEFIWNLENPGILANAKLSGSIKGEGIARVYLFDGEKEYLIFESSKLTNKGNSLITGNTITDNKTENIIISNNSATNQTLNQTANNKKISNGSIPSSAEEITIDFAEICNETCDLTGFNLDSNSYVIRIKTENNIKNNIILNIGSITYEIIEEELPEIDKTELAKSIEKHEEKLKTGKKGKRISVSGPDNFIDIPVSSEVDEIVKVKDAKKIKVYWVEENRFIDFEVVDSDNNGLVDSVSWNVPHLSNQTFEIIIDILNVQSYPVVGGEWTVEFTTLGKANLTITAVNGTTWSNNPSTSQDLRFLDLKCGNEIQRYEWINNSVFIEDYECDEIGFERSQVISAGVHTLEFQFGEETEHAYNLASDFKVQRGNLILNSGSLTGTITEGIDFDECIGPCFIKHVSTRNSGIGITSGGGTQNFDDFETYVSDDSGLTAISGNIVFERHGTANNNRLAWEIWEYTGQVSGDNEMSVLDTGVCTFVPGSLTCDGAVISPSASNNNDVVVFITGHANPDTGTTNGQQCWVTSAWIAGSNLPRFTRGESGNNCDVSYAVVEFTGANWNVQRIQHSFSGAATQTETITNVQDIGKAFFHTQQRNAAGGVYDGLCHSGSEVELTGTTTLTYRLPQTTSNWGSNMNAVTWIIWNTQTGGNEMIVNHYNPTERAIGVLEEDNWQETITALTYGISEAAISGLSGQSDGCGTAFPRGYISAFLTDSNTVDFWQSDSGQTQEYTFQIIEFPTITLSNFPPTTPTNILCNSGTDCDITVDTSLLLEGIGSTDIESDGIDYFLESFLENSENSGDIESGTIQIQGELGDQFTDVYFAGFESGAQGWIVGGSDSFRSNINSFVTDTGASGGAFSWELRDNSVSSYTEQTFNFAGFDRIDISWNSFFTNIEIGEILNFMCNSNIVWAYNVNTQGTQNTWLTSAEGQSISITPGDCGLASFGAGVVLRFESEFSDNTDEVFIDGIDIKGVNEGVPDVDSTKLYTNYNDIFSTNLPSLTSIDFSIAISNYDPSGSAANANVLPDLELEVFDGTGFVSLGVLGISGTGTYFLSTTNPAILNAWQASANTDLRIRGIGFDYFDPITFDEISFNEVSITRTQQDWAEIGNHQEGFSFNWDTSLLQQQSCVNLRTRSTDPLGSTLFSDYFTKGSCLEINHPDTPTIINIETISNVDLIPGGTTDVIFIFTAEDLDGNSDFDDLTASATFSKTGETSRVDSNGCTPISDPAPYSRIYECSVSMEYYDAAGTWDVTVSIDDLSGLTGFDTTTAIVNLLQAISLSPAAVSFPLISPGETNINALTTTTITNEGNFEIPADSDISIIANDLTGTITPSEIIDANRFAVAPSLSGDACALGDIMSNSVSVPITGFTLTRGESGNTNDLSYCLVNAPSALSAQTYSAAGIDAWTITVLFAALSIKNNRNRKKRKSNLDLIDEELKERYGIGLNELVIHYKKDKAFAKIEINIPTSIFKHKLSPAEAVCKYLKENKNLKYVKVAEILHRNERTVWINYRNAVQKMKEKIKEEKSEVFIPIKIFANRNLSILESAVLYFKNQGLSNTKISSILGKNSNNIWTLYNRAVKKKE